jgi:hypothetical protein
MKRTSEAGRPRERTAHNGFTLPGLLAFYAQPLEPTMLEGFVTAIRGQPYHIGAFGTIETAVPAPTDRPLAFDARAVRGRPERVLRHDGRVRCIVTLATFNGKTLRLSIDAPSDAVEAAIRRARG